MVVVVVVVVVVAMITTTGVVGASTGMEVVMVVAGMAETGVC